MDDSTRLQVDSLHETARRQQARWQWTAARDTLRRAIGLTQEADRADTVALLSTERMLAEVLRELGDLHEAQRLASALVPRCEKLLGAGHPGTVRARAVLATIAYDLGDRDTAYGLCRQVIDSGKGTEGPAARAVLLTQANLARLHRDRGEPDQALTALRAAYGAFRRRYGDEDLDTLRMAADLAEMYLASGDRPAARQLLTRAHHRVRALLGGGHPFTVRLEERLAEVEPPMPTPPEPEGERRRNWRKLAKQRPAQRAQMRQALPQKALPQQALEQHALEQHALEQHALAQEALMQQALTRQELARHALAQHARTQPESVRHPQHRPPRDQEPPAQQPIAQQPSAQQPPAQQPLAWPRQRDSAWQARLRAAPEPRQLPERRLRAALRRHKNPLLATALAAVVVAGLCAVVAESPAVVRGLRSAGQSLALRTPTASPTSVGAPDGLALADHGASITVGWDDPSHGTAAAVVSLSKNGVPVGTAVTLALGTTSYTATRLDPAGDYCFLVALLAPDATSAQPASICTTRHGTARPTPVWSRSGR